MEREGFVQRYFDAWNAHDADAIVATFAPGGTYEDPATDGPLEGAAIGENAAGLWAAFPDLRFETGTHAHDGDGLFAAQWTMLGTNSAPFAGLPPTGRSVVLPGADFIRVGEKGIESVRGYFSAGAIPEQLGMQVIVQPDQVGPFTFGLSTRVATDKAGQPGAFSITSLRTRSPEDDEAVAELGREIAMQMTDLEGFMGLVLVSVAGRKLTISAWEKPEHPKQLMRVPAHRKSARGFFGTDYADGGFVSVWTPEHIGAMWARCGECGAMVDTGGDSGACECGAALPEAPPYW